MHFYECSKFDPKNNACTDHENRGEVCRGYPWGQSIYKNIDLNTKFYCKDCGYKIDQDIYRLQLDYLILLQRNQKVIEEKLSEFFQGILSDMKKSNKISDNVFEEVEKSVENTLKRMMQYFSLRFIEMINEEFEEYQNNIEWE